VFTNESDGTVKVLDGAVLNIDPTNVNGFTNEGTLKIAGSASVHLDITGSAGHAALIDNTSGTINDTAAGASAGLFIQGNATLNGGTLDIGNNSDQASLLWNYDPSGTGATLTLGSGLTIEQTGTAGIYSTNATTAIADVVISYATIDTSAATFVIQPDSFTNYGQINADSNGGTLDIIPTDWFTNYGTIAVSNGESVTIGNGYVSDTQPGGATNETAGVISVAASSYITISASTLTNDGTLEVNGGTVDVIHAVDGTGFSTIANSGTLEFDATVSASQTITFEDATGTLALGDPADFHGVISGLVEGDTVKLLGIAAGDQGDWTATPGSYSGGTTTVTVYDPHGSPEATLALSGDYSRNTFTATVDGNNVLVADPPAATSATDTTVTSATDVSSTGASSDTDSPAITGAEATAQLPSGSDTHLMAGGTISFTDGNAADTVTAASVPANGGQNYLGTFSLDPVGETNGSGTVDWHFSLNETSLDALSSGQIVTQSYQVTLADAQTGGAATETVAVSIGGPGSDTFVFNPGIGADVIANFSVQAGAADKIDLSSFHLSDYAELQQLMVPANGGHDTLINLGHGDSILIANIAPSQLTQKDFILQHA
jgi:hypothetical protein